MTDRITSLYTLLVERAGDALARPGAANEEELAALNHEIEEAVNQPLGGEKLIFDEERILSRCLLRLYDARKFGEPDRVRVWSQIIGVLLPVAREHFSEAIDKLRRARPATTDHDYQRR